ncbi:MAG: alpha-E domain-containing protein [Steroidobacteraceae bacterium]
MLARVAENVYWFARYLERAENTARLVNVNAHLLLDLPRGIAPGWLPLVDISGSRDAFDARHPKADERNVVHYLVADPENPGSIYRSLRAARENARTLREVLPTAAWEMLNEFHAAFARDLGGSLTKRVRFNFLNGIVRSLQLVSGALDGTMNRNAAHTFLLLGRDLERADMTSRIIDVRSAQLLPAETPELRPFESVQWMSVLKSLSGYQMYRFAVRSRVRRADVLQFLLRNEQFPRTCLFCLNQLEPLLRSLPRSEPVLETLEAARGYLARAALDSLDQPGLHAFIDRLQLRINEVHEGVARLYFPRDWVSGEPRLVQQGRAQSQRQTRLAF